MHSNTSFWVYTLLSGTSSLSDQHFESSSIIAPTSLSEEARQLIQEQVLRQKLELGHVYSIEIEDIESTKLQIYNIIYTFNFQTGKNCLFLLSHSIGKGGQGEVLLAENLETRKYVAVKIHPDSISADEDRDQERKMLREFNRFVGVAQNQEGLHCTLMEYVRSIKLFDLLYERDHSYSEDSVEHFSKKEKLPLLKRAELIMHALSRVVEFHIRGIAHRDIKTDNFVAELPLNTDLNPLVLIDVGSAYRYRKINEADIVKLDKTNRSTKGYSAPEMDLPPAQRPFITGATDLFSLGIVIAEILTQINFQKVLRAQLLLIEEIERFDRNLTISEIKHLLSDVFSEDFVKPIMYDQELNSDATILVQFLHRLLIGCTNEDPTKRPDLDALITFQSELRKLYGKYEISEKYTNPHYMQNILAARRLRARRAEGLPSAETNSAPRRYIPESPKLSARSQVLKLSQESLSSLSPLLLSSSVHSSLEEETDMQHSPASLIFSGQRRHSHTGESHPRRGKSIKSTASSDADDFSSDLEKSPKKERKKNDKAPSLTKRTTLSSLTKKFRSFGLGSSHHHGAESEPLPVELDSRISPEMPPRPTLVGATHTRPSSVPILRLEELRAQPVVLGESVIDDSMPSSSPLDGREKKDSKDKKTKLKKK